MTALWTQEGQVELEGLPLATMSAKALSNGLAKINRFAGQTPVPWPVATHSLLVSKLCRHPQEQAWGLLHDAHEAFLGDIISPAVTFVISLTQGGGGFDIECSIAAAKAAIDFQIIRAWCLDTTQIDMEEVDHYDRIALDAEMIVFFGRKPGKDPSGDVDRAVELIRELEDLTYWQNAAAHWLLEANRLDFQGALSRPLIQSKPAA